MLRILCRVWLALALCLCTVTESQADDPVWKVIPSSAQAVTIVRDMESFSHKIDHVAGLMGVEAPYVLDFAMEQSNIRDGLNVTGNLAWVVRPYMGPQGEPAIGTLYLLPTTNYNKLIKPLAPMNLLGGVRSVTLEGRPAFVAPMKESAVFAFGEDENALRENLTLEATLEAEITPLAPWLEKQEVYFFLTQEGLKNGGRGVRLPFAKGSGYLQSMLEGIQGFALSTYADVADPQSLSLGVGIDQQGGVTLNGRVHTGPQADLSPFFPAQPPRREETLNRLRDGEIAFAIGGYLSPQYNELLTLRLQESLSSGLSIEKLAGDEREKWLVHLTKAKINVQRFQFGFYSPVLPDPPPLAVAKQPEDNEKPIKGKKLAIQKKLKEQPKEEPQAPVPVAPNPIHLALLRSLVLVLTVENSKESLDAIENWFATMPVPLDKLFVDPEAAKIFNPKRVQLLGVQCLQSGDVPPIPDVHVDWPHLIIAAADEHTLVVICGGVKELEQALAPFQALGRNVLQREIVHDAVELLPEKSAWIAVFDGKRIADNFVLLSSDNEDLAYQSMLVSSWSSEIQEDSLLAIGTAWEKSMLDVTVSPSPAFMKSLGEFGVSFGVFTAAVSGPTPGAKAK